jgi:hypothetical protein
MRAGYAVPPSSIVTMMDAESAANANDVTTRSSLSVSDRGAPPAAGTMTKRSCI